MIYTYTSASLLMRTSECSPITWSCRNTEVSWRTFLFAVLTNPSDPATGKDGLKTFQNMCITSVQRMERCIINRRKITSRPGLHVRLSSSSVQWRLWTTLYFTCHWWIPLRMQLRQWIRTSLAITRLHQSYSRLPGEYHESTTKLIRPSVIETDVAQIKDLPSGLGHFNIFIYCRRAKSEKCYYRPVLLNWI